MVFALLVVAAAFVFAWRNKPAPSPLIPAISETQPTNTSAASVTEEKTNSDGASALVEAVKTPPEPVAELLVGKISLERKPGSHLVYAVGKVTNNSPRQQFGVKVELELRGKDAEKLGTAQDYLGVLEPHKSWNFRALVTDPKTDSAVLTRVSETKE